MGENEFYIKQLRNVLMAIISLVFVVNAFINFNDYLILQKYKSLDGKALEYDLCMNNSPINIRVLCLEIFKSKQPNGATKEG